MGNKRKVKQINLHPCHHIILHLPVEPTLENLDIVPLVRVSAHEAEGTIINVDEGELDAVDDGDIRILRSKGRYP